MATRLRPVPRTDRGRWGRAVLGLLFGLWLGAQTSPLAAAQPDMVLVPAGPFFLGDDQGEADEGPRRPATLPTFRIDRTEVTVGAYAACVRARRCVAPQPAPPRDADPRLPVTGVSQRDAAAYCAFRGARLPTEAEWEKAARGPAGLRYPFGDEFACDRGNFGSFRGEGRCAAQGAAGRPLPVGRYPQGASPYGALDMAGNVWEWVADRYEPRYDQEAMAVLGFAQVAERPGADHLGVLRGGGCCSIFGLPRAADRLPLPMDYRDVDLGFRCAR